MRVERYDVRGSNFAGPIGALIPAGGRLLLALAERLATDRGIGYVMCDTDSISFARPDEMPREEFVRRVQEVCDWFLPLSPFQAGPLLEIEDVNYWDGELVPLIAFAISAKRSCLYNRQPNGEYRIRKFSAHGTGDLINGPAQIGKTPEPCVDNVHDLGGPRWMYDFWYHAISQAEVGRRGIRVVHPDLSQPVINRATMSNWHTFQMFKEIEGLKPSNFISVLPPLNRAQIFLRRNAGGDENAPASNYDGLEDVTFYAPYAADFDGLRGHIRRSDTHELVNIEHKTFNERLAGYCQHPEVKSWPFDGVGLLERRHVYVVGHEFIGKESNQIRDETADETGEIIESDAPVAYLTAGLAEAVKAIGVPALAKATGLSRQTLYDIANWAKPGRARKIEILRGVERVLRVQQRFKT